MLTAKQQELLLFIHERLGQGGVSPSFDEMKDALGLKSKSGIHRLITALEERGFIRRLAHRARALEVLKLPDEMTPARSVDNVIRPDFGARPRLKPVLGAGDGVEIPLHGRIAAGTPIEALQNVDSHITVPPNMLGAGNHFALEVSGDSMIEKGIFDGDTVLIESCDSAHEGDVIVALIDDEEATLKTLRRQSGMIVLEPASPVHESQTYTPDRVRVQGRLVGLLRQY